MGVFFLISVLCLSSSAAGVELMLHRQIPYIPGTPLLCGVLQCEEKADTSVGSGPGLNQSDNGVTFNKILSMKVFQKAPGYIKTNEMHKRANLVASLTTQQPSVTRVADDQKVDGFLDDTRATLRMELVRQEDCKAEFTCEVRGIDIEGKELLSTTSLLQHPVTTGPQAGGDSLMPYMSLQVLSLVHQLDTKFSHMARSLEESKSVTDSMEKSLGEKMASFERRLDNKLSLLEKGFREQAQSLERRVEDKLQSLENRLEDKIDNMKHNGDMTQAPSALREELENEKGQTLKDMSHHFEQVLDLLASLQRNFTQLDDIEQTTILVKAMIAEMKEKLVSGNMITHQMLTNTISSYQNLLANANQTEANLNECNANTRSELTNLFLKLSANISTNLETTAADIFTPKTCKRGIVSVLSSSSFPYPVIQPSRETTLDVPHLCDTVTDGGGWIVIQRRTTGHTNFNRDWADYRSGFGSIDDDFWLGNDKIHALTSSGEFELRVELRYKGKAAFAHYGSFSIASESRNYTLSLGPYDGTAGDSFSYHKGQQFTTMDKDHDAHADNCAIITNGGWWFKSCDTANLNGKWAAGNDEGMEWNTLTKSDTVSFSEMKIRQVG